MKEKIINYLRNNPESRELVIAFHLNVWYRDDEFSLAMFDLEREGKIKATYHDEPEVHFTFSLVEA